MHERLVQQIRSEMNSLVDRYDLRLRVIPGYAGLPQQARQSLERRVLELIAACLETNSDQPLIDYVRERAEQVLAADFKPEWFQQAVAVPEEIVTLLVTTVAESNFVWRTLNRAQQTTWHIVAEERKRLEREFQESLERRSRQVRTSTEVAQDIATATDLDELFQRVVTLIKERFDYYHAQIFRYDPVQDAVVLVTGYGEAGQQMLAAGHKLQMGRGVVGTAAASARSLLATDTAQDKDWRPNPNLPDTRGELAVPIKLRDQVLGILDVQSDRVGALTAEDQLLLEGLCGQIAVAIESRRAEDALREREEDLNAMLEYSPEAIGVVNTHTGLFEKVNRAAEQLYGLKRDELIKVGPAQMSPEFQPDGRPSLDAALEKLGAALKGETPVFEWIHVNAAGQPIQCEVRLAGLTGARSHLVRFSVTDITERKQAEEVLRRSEAQLSEALKLAKLGYWEYDVQKDLFFFNDQFYSIFHTTAEQAGGYRLSSAQYAQKFVHPDDLPIVGAEIEKALSSTDRHYNRQLEHRVLYADGGVGYISVNINIDRDEQGRILRYYGANQDVTASKLAEQTVREEQQRTQTILETITVPVIISRLSDSQVLYANQALAEIGQIDLTTLIGGRTVDFFANRDDRNKIAELLQRQGYVSGFETQLRRGTGSLYWVLLSARIIHYKNDLCVLSTYVDITERRQAEEALAQEQSLMHALMDSVTDQIYFKDLQSRVVRISKSQADRFGLSDPTQAAGKTDFDFFTEEHARPAYEDEQEIIRTGQPISIEERETWADRPDTWVLTTKFPLRNEAGDIVGTFGRSIDITERKQAEAERERLLADQQKRTLQLQTASEVSRAASSILNTDELLPQAVELIRARFNLYYVGIFLTDDTTHWAMLRAGTGEAGQQMLANGHKLKIGGDSMISQCVLRRQAQIALDTGEAAVRFDNPLLPLTRSEAALPLISRGRVIGAMTIQSDQPAAFSADDITILQSMADQISNAVENARLYEQAQAALQEVDAINRRLTGEAWDTYLRQQAGRDVIRATDDEGAAPEALPELDEQLTTGEITIEPDPEDESEATVTAPILLRGQPIGAVRLRTPLADWGDDTKILLADITGHIAQAVENARLIEQTQRTAQRERMINEINARVRQSVDLDAILRTAVNELGQSLKAARVVARVGTLTTAAGDGRGKMNE